MTKKIIQHKKHDGCAKCQQSINVITHINRWPGLGAKIEGDGAWCFGCFQKISHCKVCGESVAQVEYHQDKPDNRLHWTTKPKNGFKQHNKFICSQKCLDSDLARKKQKRQERLSQGWKECVGCVEKLNFVTDKHDKIKWMQEAEQRGRFVKLVPPGEKFCGNFIYVGKGGCKWNEQRGKPAEERGKIRAQVYWDNLSHEGRLWEIEKTDSIETGKWYGKNYTVEELAARKEVIPPLVEKFTQHELGKTWSEIEGENNSNNTDNKGSKSGDENNLLSSGNPKEEKAQIRQYFLAHNIQQITLINGKLVTKKNDNSVEVQEVNSPELEQIRKVCQEEVDKSLTFSKLQDDRHIPTSNQPKNKALVVGLSIGGIIIVAILVTCFLVRGKKKQK